MQKIWLGLLVITISGCATITKGTTQSVAINTPGVQGARCTLSSTSIGTRSLTAPATIVLDKGADNVAVRCVKECFEDGVGVIGSSLETMTAGNILVGGVIGVGVDAASGAMNKYAPEATIVMAPKPGCRPTRISERGVVPKAKGAG